MFDPQPDDLLEPHPRQTGLWAALMAATVGLSLWSWSRLEGSPLADVVEYLERAQAFVRGDALIDAQPIRAIGVSLLHAPALWVADLFGIGHTSWVLGLAGVLHIAITCAFVAATVVLARELSRELKRSEVEARLVGWVAGVVALCCPTLLQYAPIAMTDIPAGAALSLGWTYALLGDPTRRRARISGAMFGLSALCAYKAIPLVIFGWLATLVVRLLRNRPKEALAFAGTQFAVIAIFAVVQGLADWATYGSFAKGLSVYVLINFGQVLAANLVHLGLDDLSRKVYFAAVNAIDTYSQESITATLDSQADPYVNVKFSSWYFDHFHWVLSRILAPFIGIGVAVATWRAARLRAWPLARAGRILLLLAPIGAAALFAFATAIKGSRDIRIWLPILPILSAYAALGLVAFGGAQRGFLSRPRAALATLALGAALLQCGATLRTWPGSEYAAFRDAAQGLSTIGERLPAPADGRRRRVASSYNWATLFRTPGDWNLVKLPHQLSGLDHVSEEGRAQTFDALLEQDALILHSALLTTDVNPTYGWRDDFVQLVADNFHVAAAYWDPVAAPHNGIILVLTRQVPDGDALRVLSRLTPSSANADGNALRLERTLQGTQEIIELSGLRATLLPGDGIVWVEVDLDRRSPEMVSPYYAIHLEAHGADGQRGYTQVRRPGWGKRSFKGIAQGMRLTEGLPVAPRQGPLGQGVPWEPIGPKDDVTLWFDLATSLRNSEGRWIVNGRLEPMDPRALNHAERDDIPPWKITTWEAVSDDGFRYSPDSGALLIGTIQGREGQTLERQWTLRLEGPLDGQ